MSGIHAYKYNMAYDFSLFWSLSSHSRVFHSYGYVTIAGEGLQMLGTHGH